MHRALIALTLVLVFILMSPVPAETVGADTKVTVQQDSEGVTVNVNGKLFTRYLIKSGAKPILYPLIGPTGKEMTRGYPMRAAIAEEKEDHIHHRSFWFTHGDVNGVDFWAETKNHGVIKHRKFSKVAADGDRATIVTVNDWIGPDGVKHCEDERQWTFGADEKSRWVDAAITVKATDRPVKFGDTKEGCFGVRVAGSMRVELGKGGRIVNSEGESDIDAWGKPAAWVDYSGPVDGEAVGVAILNHPTSFRFPTYWHVRTYGLFAANPFGLHHFKRSNEFDGSHTLQPGESFRIRYRVLLHQGNADTVDIAQAFQHFAKE